MARPEKWDDKFLKIAEKACELGATDQDLADMLDISLRTLYYWRTKRPELAAVMKVGKEVADDQVERSLYRQAMGYEQDEVKIFMPAGAEAPVYAPYRAKVAPSATAAIFWLKNRRADDWRDKVTQEHTGPNGGPVQMIGLDATQLSKDTLEELLRVRAAATNGS